MADALALSPQRFQQPGVLGAIQLLKLQTNPFGQCWALPSGRDGDLQITTTHDSGGDEVTRLRSIDDVHPDMVFACSLVNSHIHVRLIGGADDQRTIYDISSAKGSGPISDKALGSEIR
ncbi:MAG TPA: hypothetical protein VGC99_19915 [Candidatus Tectomicrobia bacterium]